MMDETDDNSSAAVFVRAKHAFIGKNNDELSFEVGDLVAVTQEEEGGWWEGTLNGDTGWFPVAYVDVVSDKDKLNRSMSMPCAAAAPSSSARPVDVLLTPSSTKKQFINTVLEHFIKSEEEYILSLKEVVEKYLNPISSSNVLNKDEFGIMEGHFADIYALQASVFFHLKESRSRELQQQRVGSIFLKSAPMLKEQLLSYCANHPDAVEIINQKGEELDAFLAPLKCDRRSLIMGLSAPFRHLAQYPAVLQELHRNMMDSHPDRGDVQRSCAVYRVLKDLCESVRRQREMQLEFLAVPGVVDMVRATRAGSVCRVGNASVAEENASEAEKGRAEATDRFLALFSEALLVVEVKGADQYALIRSIPLTAATRVIRKAGLGGAGAGGGKHAFVIIPNAPSVPLFIDLASSFELDRWLEAFEGGTPVRVEKEKGGEREEAREAREVRETVQMRKRKESIDAGENFFTTCDAATASQRLDTSILRERNTPGRMKSPPEESFGGFRVNHELEMILPDFLDGEEEAAAAGAGGPNGAAAGPPFYLRPYPPHRTLANAVDLAKKNVKMRRDNAPLQEPGDALLLSIVEGYLAVGGEETAAGAVGNGPQVLVAEDEKLLVEEMQQGQLVLSEKSLVDVVYALKDQVDRMDKEMTSLRGQLEREQRARRRMEDTIKHSSLHLSTSTPKPTVEIS